MRCKTILLASTLAILSGNAIAQKESTAMGALVEKATQADIRTDAEKERDRNRKPVKTLDFFGITPDMKVLELLPGGGWYTKLLAPALREDGELTVSLFANRVKDRLLDKPGFDKVKVLEPKVETGEGNKVRLNTISAFDFGKTGFDAVLTFRNMHNFDDVGRKNINAAVFKALKPGGIYGIVDHTKRHMEPHTLENRRRADPVEIIKELLDGGFEFAGYSDMHYKADDELRYEVGRKSVTGNSDRFTLLFKKPK